MLNVIAHTIGLPPGMPGLPAPTAAMQASAAVPSGDEESQWPGYPLQPVIASAAQHPPPSSLARTFESFGREAVGLITRCAFLPAGPLRHCECLCVPGLDAVSRTNPIRSALFVIIRLLDLNATTRATASEGLAHTSVPFLVLCHALSLDLNRPKE